MVPIILLNRLERVPPLAPFRPTKVERPAQGLGPENVLHLDEPSRFSHLLKFYLDELRRGVKGRIPRAEECPRQCGFRPAGVPRAGVPGEG